MCNHDHIWFHLTQTLFLPHHSTNQTMHCLLQGLQQMPLTSHQECIFELHLLTASTPCACCMWGSSHRLPQPAPFGGKLCPPRVSKGKLQSPHAGQHNPDTNTTTAFFSVPLTAERETLVLIRMQKSILAFILMMICICLVVMRAALVMWEVLAEGLHICFLRCVSNMAWVNKGELLSTLKSISAVRVCGLHLTQWEGLIPTVTQLFPPTAGGQLLLQNSKVWLWGEVNRSKTGSDTV